MIYIRRCYFTNLPSVIKNSHSRYSTLRKVIVAKCDSNNSTNKMQQFHNFIDVYVWLNMFRAPLRTSSGAYNCTRRLWFYRWSVVVGALLVVVWPDHDQQRSNHHAPTVKSEATSAVVRS